MSRLAAFLVALAVVEQVRSAPTLTASCKSVTTQAGFSVPSFLGRWYIHQQMATEYLPATRNYCVFAEYQLKKKNWFGWELDVHNRDQEADGTVHDSTLDTKGFGLCAKVTNSSIGKLEVAPCFLPPLLSGPYWVLHFDQAQGLALVVGGQPSIPTHEGLCKTGSGVNNAGLWIFQRTSLRNESMIATARAIATANGIDVDVLNDVDQTNCTYH